MKNIPMGKGPSKGSMNEFMVPYVAPNSGSDVYPSAPFALGPKPIVIDPALGGIKLSPPLDSERRDDALSAEDMPAFTSEELSFSTCLAPSRSFILVTRMLILAAPIWVRLGAKAAIVLNEDALARLTLPTSPPSAMVSWPLVANSACSAIVFNFPTSTPGASGSNFPKTP